MYKKGREVMSSKEGVTLTLKGRNKDPLTGRYPLLVEGFSRVGNLVIHHTKGVEEMSFVTLTVHLEFDEEPSETLLAEIANSSIRDAIEKDWSPGGENLAGYEGALVKSVTITHNGIEIGEA